ILPRHHADQIGGVPYVRCLQPGHHQRRVAGARHHQQVEPLADVRVEAGQVKQVCRRAEKEPVDILRGERLLDAVQPVLIGRSGNGWECIGCHGLPPFDLVVWQGGWIPCAAATSPSAVTLHKALGRARGRFEKSFGTRSLTAGSLRFARGLLDTRASPSARSDDWIGMHHPCLYPGSSSSSASSPVIADTGGGVKTPSRQSPDYGAS